MKQTYLRCNVFVCPSTIENSPNSLGEAQLLGVPCVAAYVGGVSDMMTGTESGLYRFDEIEMLAYKIVAAFKDGNSYESVQQSKIAAARHDRKENACQLIRIYEQVR